MHNVRENKKKDMRQVCRSHFMILFKYKNILLNIFLQYIELRYQLKQIK